jgi:hypothetical protein
MRCAQTFAASQGLDLAGARADFKDDGTIKPRQHQVRAFAERGLLNAHQPIENDCPLTTLHCIRKPNATRTVKRREVATRPTTKRNH